MTVATGYMYLVVPPQPLDDDNRSKVVPILSRQLVEAVFSGCATKLRNYRVVAYGLSFILLRTDSTECLVLYTSVWLHQCFFA